jgi:serine/threonine-protein kinase
MIQNPDQFYGRSRELNRILSRIGADRPQSVSVVGDRRIGKSSLLNALKWKETQERYLGEELQSILVFMDFQRFHKMDLEDFFLLLEKEIRHSCTELPRFDGLSGYGVYQSILEQLKEKGQRLLLLFDEFDAITSNPAFDLDFYSFMRSAANNYPVGYVTSSKVELQKICYSSDVADSPFFNIFSNLYLRPFERKEALELIRLPSQEAGFALEKYSEDILALAGLFPFYLQIACSVYFEWLQEQGEEEPDREELKERYLEEAGPHFHYFWEHLNAESKHVMKQLLANVQPGPEFSFICRKLQKDGHLVKEGVKFRLFSPAFADYVKMLESAPNLGGTGSEREFSSSIKEWGPGEQLNQYRIIAKAGEGGMGVVYKAEDDSLQRNVALKLCHPSYSSVETVRKRLQREAVAAASLDHPSITAIHEMFEHSGQLTLVLEWIDGITLKDLVMDQGRINWRKLIPWLIEACEGLQSAHEKGIIHRDIKSSNLMITETGHTKITDFGLAKRLETESVPMTELTGEGDILGTIAYMSPEQAKGETVDHRSDLFSLGVVMFECLTGKLPFQRDNAAAILHAVTNEPVPYLGLYQVSNAERLDGVLKTLLEKSPEDRYPSADDARKDLGDLLRNKKSFLSWIPSSKDLDW